jgi:hypothetical protein
MASKGYLTIGSDGMRKLHQRLRSPQDSYMRFHKTWLDGLIYIAKAHVGVSTPRAATTMERRGQMRYPLDIRRISRSTAYTVSSRRFALEACGSVITCIHSAWFRN